MTSSDKFATGLRTMGNADLAATTSALADAIRDRDRLTVRAITHAAMRRTRPLPAGVTWGAPPSLDRIRASGA